MRELRRCAVLLLIACLVADMATPFLPGAFRLDPSESVEVAAGRNVVPAGLVEAHHGRASPTDRVHRPPRPVVTAHALAALRRFPQHARPPDLARSAARTDAASAVDDD